MNEKTKAWLIAIALFFVFGLVGRMDYTYELEKENAALKIKNAAYRGVKVGLAEVAK
ncbi:MAG: hypothetical protein PHP85_14660 [Gallionella sp.]|nr:hypothetical protein [Gallionella sp.]